MATVSPTDCIVFTKVSAIPRREGTWIGSSGDAVEDSFVGGVFSGRGVALKPGSGADTTGVLSVFLALGEYELTLLVEGV